MRMCAKSKESKLKAEKVYNMLKNVLKVVKV